MDRRNFLKTAVTATGTAALTTGLPTAFGAPETRAGAKKNRRVLTGIEVLARDDYRILRGQRVGLISNP
ncbi:MAG: twin-arginine translocation signal domain-containing protein, partial [Marmoricola sp.]